MRKFTFIVTAALVLVLGQAAIFAQTPTGTLSGTVLDPQGAAVPGATVVIRNTATGQERKGSTNDSGAFTFDLVNPGTYSVTVEAPNFKKALASSVVVSIGKETQIGISLEIGLQSETVTVTSAQEVVNTTSPSLTSVISTRQVVDLPLPDRNPLNLAALQAGVAPIGGTGVRGAAISGLRQTGINLTQDGINAMDNFVKTSSLFAINAPTLNATAEFSVTTSTAGAEAGRGGVQVNMVTKGGSNDYHGGGFLQLINDAYNANTFFNNRNGIPKTILRQRYWGFDIGGPVHFINFGEGVPKHWSGRDKAFFFYTFEAFKQNNAVTLNRTVLTPQARTGIFRYARTCPTSPADPNCSNGVQTVNLLGLPGVPFAALNPLMTAHINQIPAPNVFTCGNSDSFNIACFQFNDTQNTTNDKHTFRYDHQLVKDTWLGSHKFEFVLSYVKTRTYPDITTNNIGAPFPGGVNGFQASTRNLVTPALVSNFGSNWTNVFRYGRQWAPVDFNRDSQPTAPFISLPGVLTNWDNTFMPQPRNTIVNQFTDTLSWVKGDHLWKFGADFQQVEGISRNDAGINQLHQLGTNAANGNGLTLSLFPGGTSQTVTNAGTVYNAIVGLLGSSTQTVNVTSPDSGFVPGATRLRIVRARDLGLFAQDQWKMRSNFTLNYGVRWDYMGVPTVPNGLAIQAEYKDFYGISGFGNLFQPTAAPGSQTQAFATLRFVSGDTGIGLYKNDWDNFAPYIGFAYSPSFKSGFFHWIFGDEGTSSFRGGYNKNFLRDGVTTFTNLLGVGLTNPGLIQTSNISPLSCTGQPPSCVPSSNIRGQLAASGVPLIFAPFQIPITDRQNFVANASNGLWTADPDLRVGFVHQWNIGFEREIMKNTAFEIRYVGNYAPNLWRAWDINEVNIFNNGFLQEFINAQRNLAARGGSNFAPDGTAGLPACASCVPLPILSKFFTGFSGTSTTAWQSSTFITALNNNNVGAMANTLAFNAAYRTNRENAALGIPANFFVANPNAAFARVLDNSGKSWYNAMQVELRRRFSGGLQFQADFTWSKAMLEGDATGNNQSDLAQPLTLRNRGLDHRRSPQDQTLRFVTNALYELPFGRGKRFLDGANGFVDRIVGGWTVGGIYSWATGNPWYVTSGRSTVNQFTGGIGAQLVGITFDEFLKNTGLYKTDKGIFFVNPALLDVTYSATTGQATGARLKAGLMSAPAPGTFGNFPVNSINGPDFWTFDLSVTKRIPITERVRMEFKVTALNILNTPMFNFGNVNFDSTTFGLVTSQNGNPRNVNFIGSVRF